MKKLSHILLLTFLLTYPLGGKSNCPNFSLKENLQSFSYYDFVNPKPYPSIKLSGINLECIFDANHQAIDFMPAREFGEYVGYQMIPDMLEFSAILNEDKVELKWILEKERSNENYIIEKSKDGKKFTTLLNVSHVENGSSYIEYFETDYKPSTYYRLKQRSNDHSEYQYSQIAQTKPTIKYPGVDPITELKNALINEHSKESLIVVRDKDGAEFTSKVVFSVEDSGIIGVDPSNTIPPGSYLIIASKISAIDKQKIVIK